MNHQAPICHLIDRFPALPHRAGPACGWLAPLFLAFILAGCGKPPGESSPVDIAQLQGDPIQPSSSQKPGSTPAVPPSNPSSGPAAPPLTTPVQTLPQRAQRASVALSNAIASGTITSPAPPASASAGSLLDDGEDYVEIQFSQLAGYEIEITDALLNPPTNTVAAEGLTVSGQIPADVRALDRKLVMLKGFMLPLKVEGGLVAELLLMKDQSLCCFGATPRINDWVSVKINGRGVQPLMDQPVTFFGRLQVGEIRENGYLVGIYSMDAHDMAGPLDF